jgi:NAD(P)-dependent dehydrogenase (short-subunit alcohol dehydrogenase family)
MGTYAITGSASGIGAATTRRLREAGHRVIGVDRVDADVIADLSTPDGRRTAVGRVIEEAGLGLDGFVPCAGVAGLPGRPASLLVSINYFGAIEMIIGLRDALAATGGAVVAISSNSTTCQPGYSLELVDALLAGEETLARQVADEADSLMAYPATKTAIARWIRRHAPQEDWVGAGVRLNAVTPGMVETPLVDEGRADPTVGPLLGMYPMPLGRAGRPDEIAAAIDFLLNTEFCVGTLLLIDGGTEALFRPDDWPTVWAP